VVLGTLSRFVHELSHAQHNALGISIPYEGDVTFESPEEWAAMHHGNQFRSQVREARRLEYVGEDATFDLRYQTSYQAWRREYGRPRVVRGTRANTR